MSSVATKTKPTKPVINSHHLTLLGERYDEYRREVQLAADALYNAIDHQDPFDAEQGKQHAIEAKAYADGEYIVAEGKSKNVPPWIDRIRNGVLKPRNARSGTDLNRAAVSHIGRWLPAAIKLNYNMTDPNIVTLFAYFCLALETADGSGTTVGNYKGEWSGGAFPDYSSYTKGPLAK